MVASTIAFLVAGRFGLAPTVKKSATPGLQLVEDPAKAGQKTGDPAGIRIRISSSDQMGQWRLGKCRLDDVQDDLQSIQTCICKTDYVEACRKGFWRNSIFKSMNLQTQQGFVSAAVAGCTQTKRSNTSFSCGANGFAS